jgi:hypothetical protein
MVIKNGLVRPQQFLKNLVQKVRSCQGCAERREVIAGAFGKVVRRPQQRVPVRQQKPR